jgi:hypothetical protein
VDVPERRRGERRRSVAPVSTTSRAAALAELTNRAGEQNARTERTAGAEEAGRLLKTPLAVGDVGRRRGELSGPRGTAESAGPAVIRADRLGTNLAAVFGDLVRGVIREELCAAFADHRAELQSVHSTRLVPLAQAAQRLGLTPKALRSRIERGSVAGAVRIGGRVARRGRRCRSERRSSLARL